MVITAVHFEHTNLKTASAEIVTMHDSFQVGESLGKEIDTDNLVHVLLLSDGLNVNCSDLINGVQRHLPDNVHVTGDLSGDGERFAETLVLGENGIPKSHTVSIPAFYGDRLKLGHGSLGGWDQFSPERLVTKAEKNVLYELDGEPALGLYEKYLGEKADGLPATGLLFPLSSERKMRKRVLSAPIYQWIGKTKV